MPGITILPSPSFCSQTSNHSAHSAHSNMGQPALLKRLWPKKSTSRAPLAPRVNSIPTAPATSHTMASPNQYVQMPTRRPKPVANDPPPAYSPPSNSVIVSGRMATVDSPYSFLTQFDTIFLIDDSGSMAGRSWRETSAALAAITPICTMHDADGIDIYFLNHRNPLATNSAGGYINITTTAGVENIFNSVRPLGGTPTGTRLNQILKPYLAQVEESIERQAHGHEATVKPLNIIVITDGVPSDDVESIIVHAAKKLDLWDADPGQVGIQFFQVGREPEAAEDLRELDDALQGKHGIRDMVDTVPWSGEDGQTLTAEGIMKCLLGSINRKIDRRQGSDERLRR